MTDLSSAAPLRVAGTRTRAGNAMGRTRAALIEGALKSIAQHGTRGTSMAEVADLGQIARATLYNHFRRKNDIFYAVIEHEIEVLRAQALTQNSARDAIGSIARYLSTSAPLRTIVEREPAVVTVLTTINDHELWQQARSALTDVLAKYATSEPDATHVDVILRWLLTQIAAPSNDVDASIARLL